MSNIAVTICRIIATTLEGPQHASTEILRLDVVDDTPGFRVLVRPYKSPATEFRALSSSALLQQGAAAFPLLEPFSVLFPL